MSATTVGSAARFVAGTVEPPTGDTFAVVHERLAVLAVSSTTWIRRGTVVAYHGDLRFHLERVMQRYSIPYLRIRT